jgi:hydrogenase maturation protease
LIVGVGNEYRSDDGAGISVARKIDSLGIAGVEIIVGIGDGTELINVWEGADVVYIIDCVRSGSRPGLIHRFNADSVSTKCHIFTGNSTHAFGVPESIELARRLGKLPTKVHIFGIECRSLSFGQDLSFEVETAVNEVVELIKGEVNLSLAQMVME